MNHTPAADPTPPAHSAHRPRAAWLSLLSRCTAADLQQWAAPALADYHFEWLRRPESGLVMVRARMGNSGDRFNLGEASVTRCVVRHHASDASVTAGVGYVLGLDAERATAVAQLDALLQHEALHALLWPSVIEALRAQVEQRQRDELARTASSRVQFYTLQPEAT